MVSDQPTDVYVVGGEGIIHNGVYKQIQTLSPNSQIQRLGGYDRFETLALILNKFYPNPTQYVVVPTTTTSETLTVREPSTTGFTVAVNPALNGLNASNFILLDGSTRVTISSASTTNRGVTYKIAAKLTAGHTYTVTAMESGHYFGIAQKVVVPSAATVSSAVISDHRHIILTMSIALTGSISNPDAFKVAGVASEPTVTNVAVSGTKVTLTLSSSIVSTDSYITVNYAKTGIRDLTNGAPVANFSILIVNE